MKWEKTFDDLLRKRCRLQRTGLLKSNVLLCQLDKLKGVLPQNKTEEVSPKKLGGLILFQFALDMIHTSVGGDIRSTSSSYSGVWPPANCTDKGGVAILGTIFDIRNHTIQDSSKTYHRYVAIVVDVEQIRNRKFNSNDGSEIEVPFQPEKRIGKGYLNTFDREAQIDPEAVSVEELCTRLGGSAMPLGLFDKQRDQLHPIQKDRFEFWGDSNLLKSMNLKKGDRVKLKTKGNTILIHTCSTFLEKRAQNYHGEDVLGGWTNKIQVAKGNNNSEVSLNKIPGEDKEGVDPSEWD